MSQLDFDSINIQQVWFDMGQNKEGDTSSDLAFRFIAYWIAFNAFYGHGNPKQTEKDQIKKCIENNKTLLAHLINLDTDQALSVFKNDPVYSMRGGARGGTANTEQQSKDDKFSQELHHAFCDLNRSYIERLKALMLTIYQVRCNMFHGSKSPYPERNYELVKAS